jgi:hypothetical protein
MTNIGVRRRRRAHDERKHMIVQDVTVEGLIVGLIARYPVQFCLTGMRFSAQRSRDDAR